MNLFASMLSFFGMNAASVGSQGCILGWIDEPKCPKSLIK